MIFIEGTWYDGKTSAQIAAVCRVYDNGALRIERKDNQTLLFSSPRFTVGSSPRMADTPRFLYFPKGQKFETRDNDAIDRIVARFDQKTRLHIVHLLESRWPYILTALSVLLLFLWGGVQFGIPFVSKQIAFVLPSSVQQLASKQTLDLLDRSFLKPSELDQKTIVRLNERFRPAIGHHPTLQLKIRFRKGGRIGPNALALPNGTIIFTDEMVLLAEHDDELVAVLAHEIGHVVHRHGLRSLIQDSLLGFALLAITGDVSGSSELFLGLPVLLTELSYSRKFEREADAFALAYLRSQKIPPVHFVRLLRRISRASAGHGTADQWSSFLSTHPSTEERQHLFDPRP